MKKTSTAVAKQDRNVSQQKLTIGLDLGDRNSWYCGGRNRPDTTGTAHADDGESIAGSVRGDAAQSDSRWRLGRIRPGSGVC